MREKAGSPRQLTFAQLDRRPEHPLKLTFLTKSTVVAAAAATVLTCIVSSERASAAGKTVTANFQVGAAVNIKCTIVCNGVHFPTGAYVPGSPVAVDAVGGVTATCTKGAGVDVRLSQGLYPAPGSTNKNPLRRMASGANRLAYNLYEDAAFTQVWDNVPKASKTGKVFPVTLPVYGRIPAGQMIGSGAYADTVIATIWF